MSADVLQEILVGLRKMNGSQSDRDDYGRGIASRGLDEAAIQQAVHHTADQRSFCGQFKVKASPIDGLGVFTVRIMQAGEDIGPARLAGKRTPLGRFTNHSKTPNAQMVARGADLYLVAVHDIARNREITVDYAQVIDANREAPEAWKRH